MGRGASKIGSGAAGAAGGGNIATNAEPANPIIDKDFDVTKQKPTNATDTDNMNEAQLLKEIAKAERRSDSAEREADRAFNSSSVQRFNEVSQMFPGGVGGSAVTPAYQRMVERSSNQILKGVEARERAERYDNRAERLRQAYEITKGSGLLVHEARTARAAVGGRLDGKWTKTGNAFTDGTFGQIGGQKNGEFAIGKVWGSYQVYRGNRLIGRFGKAADAKAIIEKYAKR